jgi:outer membrane protein
MRAATLNPTTVARSTLHALAAAALALAAGAAHATGLLEAWQAASRHDPQGQVLDATRDAGAARREQAAALWRPSVGLGVTAGVGNAVSDVRGAQFAAPGFGQSGGVSFSTSQHGGAATRLSLLARQPLLNPERAAQQRQLELSGDAAQLEWQAARQDWMLQLGQRYFDLMLAAQRLDLAQRQHTAVQRALAEVRERFALGDAPITDTHEATAHERALAARVTALRHELEQARLVLADSTGADAATLSPRSPHTDPAPVQGTLQDWLARAGRDNPALRLQQTQADMAAQEVRKQAAAGAPTLDLVAQAQQDRLNGGGDHGAAGNVQRQQMIGISLQLPLYTGGMHQARETEAARMHDRALAALSLARVQLAQRTRAAWQAQQSAAARLAALGDARTAALARLDATRLGRQVGDRTTLDLLRAENDADSAQLSLLQARVDWLLGTLALHALAGALDEAQLAAVDRLLAP